MLDVGEERHDREIPESHIIAQDRPPGTQVPENSHIAVVVSLGPERVTMPNTVGFPISVRQLDLEDMGLTVTVTETWSTEPAGLIITQAPVANGAWIFRCALLSLTHWTVGDVAQRSMSLGCTRLRHGA